MSGLPKVVINVNDENLGKTVATIDGVAGMVLTGASVTGKIQTGESKVFYGLKEAYNAGITPTGINAYAYKHIKDFYDVAGNGAELWLMLVDDSVLMSGMLDVNNPYAQKLITDAGGRIRLLGVSKEATGSETISGGLDEDVAQARINGQQLAEHFGVFYQDFSLIIDGKSFNGNVADLTDLHTESKEFVSVLISNANGEKNAAIGLLLGRLAIDPVQRNPGRVKSGALPVLAGYFTDQGKVEDKQSQWDTLHDKGYIFLRSFQGKAGYFFSDAPTAQSMANDLSDIPRVRAIYKARRLAYLTFVEEILDEIPVDAQGKIAPALIKSWEAKIENALTQQMVATGEISGVHADIDPNQDILGTDNVNISLSVLPVGYGRYITIELGFSTSLN